MSSGENEQIGKEVVEEIHRAGFDSGDKGNKERRWSAIIKVFQDYFVSPESDESGGDGGDDSSTVEGSKNTEFFEPSDAEDVFNLSEMPIEGTVTVFWNGVKTREGDSHDYVVFDDTVSVNFDVFDGDVIAVKYFYE